MLRCDQEHWGTTRCACPGKTYIPVRRTNPKNSSLLQRVTRKEQYEKRGKAPEDEQVLLRTGHGVPAEAVLVVLLETRDRLRLCHEGVLGCPAHRAHPRRGEVLELRAWQCPLPLRVRLVNERALEALVVT